MGQHQGRDAAPRTGRCSKPFSSWAAWHPLSQDWATSILLHGDGSTPAPGTMLHPGCFITSCKRILPIPQAPLHWQFQRFIVSKSCYSTRLSSPRLRPQGEDPLLILSMAPQCPWKLGAAGAAAVRELALKESWLGPHAAPPRWVQGGGARPGMAVVRSRWAGSVGHLISVII